MLNNSFRKKVFLFGVFFSVVFSVTTVFAANPLAFLSSTTNILDPGSPNTPWGGCGPFDANCYTAKTIVNSVLPNKPPTGIISSAPTQLASITNYSLVSALRSLIASGLPSDLLLNMRGPQGPKGDNADTSSFVSKSFLDKQIIRVFDSSGDSFQDLSSSLGEEINTKLLIVSGNTTLGDAITDTITINGVVTAPTLDTGQGANELYDMDQNVLTTSSPTFAAVGATTFTGALVGNATTVTTNANLTGPITSIGNATSVASQTGTGSTFVMNTSPTLVTPILGVASGTSLALGGATIGSNALAVTGTVNISSTTTVGGNILASAGSINIGSSGVRFGTIYTDNLDATNISGVIVTGSTSSNDWTINSDNATADTENMSLAFERGTSIPNALLQWDATAKKFVMNAPLELTNGIGTASFIGNLTGNVTGNVSGTSGSTTGNAATVTGATFTTALIVNTGAVTLTGDAGGSTLTLGAGASSVSGANTGDNATNSQYSGLALSKADVGQTFYIGTTQVAINRASAALTLAGLTLTTPDLGTPSAAILTNASGTVANLTAGDVTGLDVTGGQTLIVTTGGTLGSAAYTASGAYATSAQGSTADAALPSASFTDSAVTGKLITGFVSGAGTVAATDTILQAINKLDGNVAGKAAVGQTMYIGTTQVAINRASAALVLTGITSIDGSSASTTGNAATVTGATFTTALIVNTGAVTLTGDVAGSTLTLGAGASSVSGANTGDNATNTQYSGLAASKADVGQTFYIGTTQVAINRASAALTLAGLTLTTPELGLATGTSLDLGTTTLYGSRAITVDTGGVLNVSIGSAAGDDFTIDTDKLVVEGDTGNVGIGETAPTLGKLVVKDGNVALTNTGTAGELKLYEPSASGTNYSAFKAPAQGADITYTLPNTVGGAGTVLTDAAGNGTLSWVTAAATGANAALSNLASVAINTTLVSDTDNTDALGTTAIGWADLFLGNGAVIQWNSAPSTADLTLTHTADTLTFAGGNIVGLGATTATTFNGLAITANGTNTLNIAAGKSLIVSNILTFTGTDSSSVAFGTGGTVLYSGGALGTPTSGTLTNATGYLWNNLAAPTGALSLTMPAGSETTFTYSATTQTGLTQTSTTLTSGMIQKNSVTGSSAVASAASSGSLLTLTSATTGFTTATQRLGAIYSTGANSNASVVLQGLDISVANTGTTNTNQALRLSASGASTTNIALDLAAGELRLAGSAGLTGKILVSAGANATPVWSTPTFPNASATSGKMIKSDGTNWVASTETYAAPGTTGNVLRSDGTNWTASASAAKADILTTARAIYGNNFDGSAALTGIIASTYGGTGNGFTKFSGPTTAEKTFTLPDASATLLYSGGALGTPSSGTLTSATGLPISGLTASTSTALGVGSVELGHATDTTLSRVSAGVAAIEGVNILTTTTGAAIGQTMYIGTTGVAINRSSAALTLAGITLTTPDVGAAIGTGLALTSANTTQVTTASALVLNANSLNSGTGIYAASSTLTSGKLIDLQVSGTAAAASQTVLNILTAGANATNAITTYGAQISNTHTNVTSGTNIALYLNASGATTANYGLIVNAGSVGIGTTGPDRKLDVLDVNDVAQMRLTQTDGTTYSEFQTNSAGDLIVSASGGDIRMQDYNLWVCAGGSCANADPAEKGNIIVETSVLLNNGFRLKQTGASTVDMLDSGANIILQFDEAQ